MTYTVSIEHPDDLNEFRCAARKLLAVDAAPADIIWSSVHDPTLFNGMLPSQEKITTIPRSFACLADWVACHRDEQRWSLLYQALWRLDRGERGLMERAADPLVHRLRRLAAAVKHDQHRMTAFVRFREVHEPDGALFLAWYEPHHRVLRKTSGFFIDRFANMRFSILTPDLTLHWDRTTVRFAPGLQRKDAAFGDAVEEWWRRYYSAVFNPSRSNPRLMRRHMPARFWRDLPETRSVDQLINEAGSRTERMIGAADPGRPA